jgi:hypothetical protein
MKRVVLALVLLGLSACASAPQEVLPPVEQTVVISAECDAGLASIRTYMAEHDGALDDEVRTYLRAEANKAYETCSVQEFRTFMSQELTPWADRLSTSETEPSSSTTPSAVNP